MNRGEVNITTYDQDIEPILGNQLSLVDKSSSKYGDAVHHLKYLLSDLNDLKSRYIFLGFHLIEFDQCCYYFDFGFGDIYSFAEANLGMDKSAISRCISVAKKFSAKDVGSHTPKIFIDEKYKDYSYSQLCEMVSMNENDCKKVTSDMTIKQIRELKKKQKEKQIVATSQQKEKKLFDYDKFFLLRGAARAAYIKSLDLFEKRSGIVFHFFDRDGKPVFSQISGVVVDLIYSDSFVYFIRLNKTKAELEGANE